MPEMSDEEKASRLELYKREATAQWDARQRAQRTPSKWFVAKTRLQFRVMAATAALIAVGAAGFESYNHRYWGLASIFVATVFAVPLLKNMEAGAYDQSDAFWNSYRARFGALVLWCLLFAGVAAIAVFV